MIFKEMLRIVYERDENGRDMREMREVLRNAELGVGEEEDDPPLYEKYWREEFGGARAPDYSRGFTSEAAHVADRVSLGLTRDRERARASSY